MYRLYFLSLADQIKDVEPFQAPSDESAIIKAEELAAGLPVELWEYERLVWRRAPADVLAC